MLPMRSSKSADSRLLVVSLTCTMNTQLQPGYVFIYALTNRVFEIPNRKKIASSCAVKWIKTGFSETKFTWLSNHDRSLASTNLS